MITLSQVNTNLLLKTNLPNNKLGIVYNKTYLNFLLNKRGLRVLDVYKKEHLIYIRFDLTKSMETKFVGINKSLSTNDNIEFVLCPIESNPDFDLFCKTKQQQINVENQDNFKVFSELIGCIAYPVIQAIGIKNNQVVYKVTQLAYDEINQDIDFYPSSDDEINKVNDMK